MTWRDRMRAACPYCRAVFTVSQAQLDARGGLVRCRDCSEVFDAAWHLAESQKDAPDEAAADDADDADAAEAGDVDDDADAPLEAQQPRPTHGEPPPHDAEQYIAPRASPLHAALGAAAALLLLLALIWQIKGFFIDEYAQHEQYRRHLAAFCRFAGCKLPLRRASARITLTHTRIDLHPRRPNAMRITVKLVNEAAFAQPYPDLQLTLTDRNGRVVGRRAFAPEFYLQGRGNLLESGELGVVHFDLARPHGKAVGFVVAAVSRSAS